MTPPYHDFHPIPLFETVSETLSGETILASHVFRYEPENAVVDKQYRRSFFTRLLFGILKYE